MNHFRPLITQRLPRRSAVVRSIPGPIRRPGSGSVIAKQERISPRATGTRYFACCAGVPSCEQVDHVRLVRRRAVERAGAEEAAPGFFQDRRTVAPRQREAAELGRQLRRVDPGFARLAAQLADHRVERRHVVRELGTLARDRLVFDEPPHALAQIRKAFAEAEQVRAHRASSAA